MYALCVVNTRYVFRQSQLIMLEYDLSLLTTYFAVTCPKVTAGEDRPFGQFARVLALGYLNVTRNVF